MSTTKTSSILPGQSLRMGLDGLGFHLLSFSRKRRTTSEKE